MKGASYNAHVALRPPNPTPPASGPSASRVILRPLLEMTPKEWARFHSYFRDREIAEWNGSSPIRMPLWLFKRVVTGEERAGERVGLGIYTPEGAFIGSVEFYDLRPSKPSPPLEATLGIVIGEKEYWGHGYGTQAMRAALEYAFRNIGIERVCLETLEYNRRARRVFEKVGFHLERIAPRSRGQNYAHYTLERSDWVRLQATGS